MRAVIVEDGLESGGPQASVRSVRGCHTRETRGRCDMKIGALQRFDRDHGPPLDGKNHLSDVFGALAFPVDQVQQGVPEGAPAPRAESVSVERSAKFGRQVRLLGPGDALPGPRRRGPCRAAVARLRTLHPSPIHHQPQQAPTDATRPSPVCA